MKGFLVILYLLVFIVACSDQKGGFLSPPEDTAGSSTATDYLAITSGDTNTRSVVVYTIEGVLHQVVANFLSTASTPRGVGFVNPETLLVSLDGTDRIEALTWAGTEAGTSSQFTNAGLNGTIYGLEANSNGDVYVLESNRVERYDSTGAQVGNSYINTTTGSCVLSNPRGLFLTSNNKLIVVNQGGSDEILIYDVSTLTASCDSNNVAGNNPYGVLLHSDGFIYFTTQLDDQVYRANADGSGATVITSVTTATLNNPTGIVELPNGNLAVASSGTDAIWEFDTSGNIVGTQPLIRDPLTLNITDMQVVNVP